MEVRLELDISLDKPQVPGYKLMQPLEREVTGMGRDLIQLIREKQALLSKIQSELDEAKALLDGRAQPADHAKVRGRRPEKGTKAMSPWGPVSIKPRSSVGRAQKVLRRSGQPLQIDELLAAINKTAGRKVKRTTLVGNLSRYVTKGVIFTRTGPNIFGLMEWDQKAGKDEAA
jgi:hypothetical protein